LESREFSHCDPEDLIDRPVKYYLDKVAKTPQFPECTPEQTKLTEAHEKRYLDPPCGEFLAVGECENGHRFGKEVFCGREWCRGCRDVSHMRRLARWLPKAQQLPRIGYFVITFPPELRPLLRNPKALAVVGRRAARVMRSLGYSRGLRRWHFFGDKSTAYNPHLNILVDGDYLPKSEPGQKPRPGELEYVIAVLRRKMIPPGLRSQLKHEQDIHYSYHRSPSRIYHKLKYITRPTFLEYSWDKPLALSLRGFRNTACWGSWHGSAVWSVEQVEQGRMAALVDLVGSICPHCKTALHWHIPKGEHQFFTWHNAIQLGFGYWELASWGRTPPRCGHFWPIVAA
jgi:hypothetical protein